MPQFGQRAEQTGATKAYHRPGSWGKTVTDGQFLWYFKEKSHFKAIRIKFCIFLKPFKKLDWYNLYAKIAHSL